jgi:hypothetical protein
MITFPCQVLAVLPSWRHKRQRGEAVILSQSGSAIHEAMTRDRIFDGQYHCSISCVEINTQNASLVIPKTKITVVARSLLQEEIPSGYPVIPWECLYLLRSTFLQVRIAHHNRFLARRTTYYCPAKCTMGNWLRLPSHLGSLIPRLIPGV